MYVCRLVRPRDATSLTSRHGHTASVTGVLQKEEVTGAKTTDFELAMQLNHRHSTT